MSAVISDSPRIEVDVWWQMVIEAGNGDPLDARIQCPHCDHIATPRMFRDAGADPDRAFVSCIGRITGAVGRLGKPGQPCDWAAGGLFTCLGKGLVVVHPDGRESDVFPFASGEGGTP